jgi:hypothetical protein
MTTATPKPRAKRQPTADVMREQLALAANKIQAQGHEISCLRRELKMKPWARLLRWWRA